MTSTVNRFNDIPNFSVRRCAVAGVEWIPNPTWVFEGSMARLKEGTHMETTSEDDPNHPAASSRIVAWALLPVPMMETVPNAIWIDEKMLWKADPRISHRSMGDPISS